MDLDADGYLRPVRVDKDAGKTGRNQRRSARTFATICPGVGLRAAGRHEGVRHHQTLGPYVSTWSGHANDPEFRFRGSSGGVISALSAWLLERDVASRVVGVAPATTDPRRTVPVSILTRAEVIESAGSRYAPVGVASSRSLGDAGTAMVGKPCEVAAARSLYEGSGEGGDPLVLLSFFCAGTPSQRSTDELVETLGGSELNLLRTMWYRGRGWPGRFTVVTEAGSQDMSYDDSWGEHLGRSIQWRCKVCIDGTGESADIAAGDYWSTDTRGYPLFDEADGLSAVIARTRRGHALLMAARADGVVHLDSITPDAIMSVQPLQHTRRSEIAGRLLGTLAAGRRVPRYRGYNLVRAALRHPRAQLRAARATRWRLGQNTRGQSG